MPSGQNKRMSIRVGLALELTAGLDRQRAFTTSASSPPTHSPTSITPHKSASRLEVRDLLSAKLRREAPDAWAFFVTNQLGSLGLTLDERFALFAPVENWHEAEPRTSDGNWLRFMVSLAS